MRSIVSIALSSLCLLGGCAEPGYPVTAALDNSPAISDVDSLRDAKPFYTSHLASSVNPEIVPIRIEGLFTAYDRAKILRAVNEWNLALNGFVRFDITSQSSDGAPQTRQPPTWMIMGIQGGVPQARGPASGRALAVTQAVSSAGGMVIVYVDRIGTRDLGRVVMHELGHVLGLAHDPHGRLMSTHYSASNQQCIDKATAEAIAASRKLPLSQLNWCENNVASAAR